MSDDSYVKWGWMDEDIPDSVEAFWNTVRHQHYNGEVRDGDICTIYRRETVDGGKFEDVILGRYNADTDTILTVIRASYDHLDGNTVVVEPAVASCDPDTLRDDGYRVAAYEAGKGLRNGYGEPSIDIHDVPEHVMEQLRDHGTYWSRNDGDVLATDRWDDRGILFHAAEEDDA